MILPYRPETEFYTAENVHIVEISNSDNDDTCSIARARVAPGETTLLHAVRGTVERYVLLEGEAVVEIDGKKTVMRPFDVALIAPGVAQRIANTGASDLIFLCVCTPRFERRNYTMLEAHAD